MKSTISIPPSQDPAYQRSVQRAWRDFIDGADPRGVIPDHVLDGWMISRQARVDPLHLPDVPVLERPYFTELCDQYEPLLQAAAPVLHMLDSCICGTGHMAILTAPSGHILATGGDPVILDVAKAQYHVPGADRTIERVGASAMSLSMKRCRPVQLSGFEHYNATLHNWRCASAPIFADSSRILAALTISGNITGRDIQALDIVTTFANYIGMRTREYGSAASRRRLEALLHNAHESLAYPMFVLDNNGRVTHANSRAGVLFGQSPARMPGKDIAAFMAKADAPVMRQCLAQLREYHKTLTFSTAGGHMSFLCTISPVGDIDGAPLGVALTLHQQARTGFFDMGRADAQPPDAAARGGWRADAPARRAGAEASFGTRYVFSDILGNSSAIRECISLARRVADRASRVVIYGESGTGKELLAQSMHNAGPMSGGPFVGISCAAIPNDLLEAELFGYEEGAFTGARKGGKKGRLELANGGTLFLDEVNSLPMDMQVKLLRVLQEMSFSPLGGNRVVRLDLRVIAASNESLAEAVKAGKFRADLYYRLNVVELVVPPLRERLGDVEFLARIFWRSLCAGAGMPQMIVAPGVLEALNAYSWPGNVRELQNVCERAWVMSDGETISLECLPEPLRNNASGPALEDGGGSMEQCGEGAIKDGSIEGLCKTLVKKTLDSYGGNISKTAEALGIARTTLYRKLKKYGMA